LFFALLLAGCAAVPKSSIEEDQKAKLFEPPGPDVGAIYVYRQDPSSTVWGIRLTFIGSRKTELSTQLPAGTFLRFDSEVGLADIACRAADLRDLHRISVAGGQIRYFGTRVYFGQYTSYCLIEEIPPEQAQPVIRTKRRVVPM
jgi:hypothetical protein